MTLWPLAARRRFFLEPVLPFFVFSVAPEDRLAPY